MFILCHFNGADKLELKKYAKKGIQENTSSYKKHMTTLIALVFFY